MNIMNQHIKAFTARYPKGTVADFVKYVKVLKEIKQL
jgi:hypothetical protein